MSRLHSLFAVVALFAVAVPAWAGTQISGDYLESRTCDVYTGPCFANSEVATAGKEAIMAWSIDQGEFQGVNLSGLKVVMVVKASDTLAWGSGLVAHPDPIRSVVLVDDKANESQRKALVAFARQSAGKAAGKTVKVESTAITFSIDHVDRVASLKAGDIAELKTRHMDKKDCVCSNEEIYYSPLARVQNAAPAYSLQNKFAGSGLKSRWTNPNARSAFLATFAY